MDREFKIEYWKANWSNLKIYPRLYTSKSTAPNFKYDGISLRWGWWTYTIERSEIKRFSNKVK